MLYVAYTYHALYVSYTVCYDSICAFRTLTFELFSVSSSLITIFLEFTKFQLEFSDLELEFTFILDLSASLWNFHGVNWNSIVGK